MKIRGVTGLRLIEVDDSPRPVPPIGPEVWVDVRSRRIDGWKGEGRDGGDIETRRFYFDTTAEADAFMAGIFMGFECEVAMYGGGEFDAIDPEER